MILIILFALVALSIFYVYETFFTNSVDITDAYCDNHGRFNWTNFYFTIVNNRSSDVNLTYKWELDDPKAGKPRSSDLTGSGSVTVRGMSNYHVIITNLPPHNYPPDGWVMNVELFEGNKSIYHYIEQKSTYNWDYSTLPPKPKPTAVYYGMY